LFVFVRNESWRLPVLGECGCSGPSLTWLILFQFFGYRAYKSHICLSKTSSNLLRMAAGTQQDIDPTFSSLSPRLRKRIDRALDTACADASDNGPSRKRRRVASASLPPSDATMSMAGGFIVDDPAPGGFVVEDEDQPMGGGFIAEDRPSSDAGGFVPSSNSPSAEDEETRRSRIPLSLIPQALQLLDLQPDDEDVLDVFRNAASGWENTVEGLNRRAASEDELFVSRKDWRAVCAALLDTASARDQEEQLQEDESMIEGESEASEDEYEGLDRTSDEVSEDDDSEDEYQEGGFMRSSLRGKGKEKAKAAPVARKRGSRKASYSSDSSRDSLEARPRQLTARQKAECRRTYALFFPDVPDSELDGKRIMIKDITRVAGVLKEKISAEEVQSHQLVAVSLH
jgi:hypothetical protein